MTMLSLRRGIPSDYKPKKGRYRRIREHAIHPMKRPGKRWMRRST